MSVRKISVKDALKFLEDDSPLDILNRRIESENFSFEYAPDRLDVARHTLQHIRGETRCDGFLLGSCDTSYVLADKHKRKSRLESSVVPRANDSGTPFRRKLLKTRENIGNQFVVNVSGDENLENTSPEEMNPKAELVDGDIFDLENASSEVMTVKPDLDNVDLKATKPERAVWVNAQTCQALENEDSRSDKENNVQQLKVVVPSCSEKQNFAIESEFRGKVYVSSPKQQAKQEMGACRGDLSLKRPRHLSSMTSLCSSNSSYGHRKLPLLDQSIRLEERDKYSELLQSFTQVPVKRQSVNSARRERSPPTSLLSYPRKRSSDIELVDLTVQKNESRVDVKKAGSASEKFGSTASGTQEPFPSSVLRKNLDKCNVYDLSWIDELSSMYDRKVRENRRKIMEEKMKAALCTKQSDQLLNEILDEKVRVHLRLTEVAVEEGPVPIAEDVEPLPELTPEMEKQVAYAFKSGPGGELLVEAFNISITRRDMQTLSKLNWLNDEVINFYMNLLIERGKKRDKYPSVHCFNTFFYPKLKSQGHSSLKRWTKKIDIFAHELLIVPVHLGVHWCLSCINMKEKRILYFDSMGGDNNTCLQTLLRYLQEECMDKKRMKFDTTGWSLENVKDNPQQMNGSDCGMFSCMYAEFLCRRAKITFSQKDMPYFRRKMAYEILNKKLLL